MLIKKRFSASTASGKNARAWVIALAGLTLTCALPASAQSGGVEGSANPSMRIFIDPDTGERRAPTAAELEALSKPTSKAVQNSRATVMQRGEAGMTIVEVPRDRYPKLRATVAKDGKVSIGHGDAVQQGHGHE